MVTQQSPALPENQNRRNLLLGSVAVATALAAAPAFSAGGHEHHAENPNAGLIDAALDCVKKGDVCQQHCIELVKAGDTSIADCLRTVVDMLPMCATLTKLASHQSVHLAALARVCIAVCEDCEKECRKHENKHAACKACAESCAACIEACKKNTV